MKPEEAGSFVGAGHGREEFGVFRCGGQSRGVVVDLLNTTIRLGNFKSRNLKGLARVRFPPPGTCRPEERQLSVGKLIPEEIFSCQMKDESLKTAYSPETIVSSTPSLRSSMRVSLYTLAVLAFAAARTQAASVPIVNPGFEDDTANAAAGGGWTDAQPTGWTDPAGGDNSNFIENIGGFSSDGSTHLGFDGNEFGAVYQDLSTAWAPNTTYTLTVGVGNRTNFGAGVGRFGFGSSLDPAPAALTAFVPSLYSLDYNTSTVAVAGDTFADAVFSFTTGAVAPAGNIRISVQNVDTATRIHVDNFRLDASAVPEPSSLALVGLFSGLLMRRRRA